MPRGQSDEDTNEPDGDDVNEPDGDDEDEDEDNTTDLIDVLTEHLPSIIALLALFSNESGYNCETIEQCMEKCRTNIDSLDKILCNCDTDKSSILACYMNQSDDSRYDKKTLIKLLDLILEMVKEPESIQLSVNLDIIFSTIRESMGKNNDALIISMTAKEVQEKIIEYLPVREEEKDKFGEVFTPAALINEMLDKLPPSVWTDPTKKWLDPANGIGNFPMIVYKRLMEGGEGKRAQDKLPDKYDKDGIKYSDESGKSRHILKHMLYMCEINKKNVAISRRIFGSDTKICCCDFLNEEEKWKKQFGIEQFDVIIGNPPFQDTVEKKDADKAKPRPGGKNKLYERITRSCLALLSPNGYLLFVTPDNIMSGNSGTAYTEIIKMKTHVIGLNNVQQRYFPNIGQSMCYFLVQNKSYDNKFETVIINNEGKELHVVLRDRPVNPVREWNAETEKLFGKYITNEKNNFIYYRGTTADDYNGGKYKVIYTTEKHLSTDNPDLAPGIGTKKIVMFESNPLSSGVVDMDGSYGVGPHTMYISLPTNIAVRRLKHFFESVEYKRIVKSTLTSQYLKVSLLHHIDVSKITGTSITHFTISGGKQTRKKTDGGTKPKRKTRRKRWF